MQSDDAHFHVTKILAQMDAACNQYHQIVLLLGGVWEDRTLVLKAFAELQNAPYVALGYSLSRSLLEIVLGERPLRVEMNILAQLPETCPNGAVLDHLEVLFDPDLSTDPLRLLHNISREYPVITSWPGEYDGRRLTYAVPSHREYYAVSVPDLCHYRIET